MNMNMNMKTNKILFLFTFLSIMVGLGFMFFRTIRENFGNPTLEHSSGSYPNALDNSLLNTYPSTGNKGLSENTSSSIWWQYPIFKVGSYAQITNNIRYPKSPDEGTCMPASMCGALYQDIQNKPNSVYVLPPVENSKNRKRVNYFVSR